MKNCVEFQKKLFLLAVALLPFVFIPNIVRLNVLGVMGMKLSVYPIIVGICLAFWQEYRYKNFFRNGELFIKYSAVYIFLLVVSLLYGLYIFPYWELIDMGQINKLVLLNTYMIEQGIIFPQALLVKTWVMIRFIKNIILTYILTFGVSYWVYCLFYNNGQEAVKLMIRGIITATILVLGYSVFDLFYLAGNEMATNILQIINPFMHTIEADGTSWPPLLWPMQLRSLFAEPSYFGMFAAFVLPILSIWLFENKSKYLPLFVLFFLVFCDFMTNARTAILLLLGEVGLLCLLAVYLKKKNIWQTFGMLVCCVLIAFVCGVSFNGYCNQSSDNPAMAELLSENQFRAYLGNNLGSLTGVHKRSNLSRFSIAFAELKIGIENPILGVGTDLCTAYVPSHFPDSLGKNREMTLWIERQEEYGMLKSPIPKLTEYTSRLAETGILGLGIFLLPFFYTFFKKGILLKKTKKTRDRYVIGNMGISIITLLMVGIGDQINIFYSMWLIFGVFLTMGLNEQDSGA